MSYYVINDNNNIIVKIKLIILKSFLHINLIFFNFIKMIYTFKNINVLLANLVIKIS